MSRHRPVDRVSHRSFCENEAWSMVRNAKGRPVGHHVTYEFPHPDGRMLRTRISRPVDKTPYGPTLEAVILRDQLEVDREEFWACVDDGMLPARGAVLVPAESLPASIVHVLRTGLHMSEGDIKSLTRGEAIRRATDYWTSGGCD